jgi:hypothetical protein
MFLDVRLEWTDDITEAEKETVYFLIEFHDPVIPWPDLYCVTFQTHKVTCTQSSRFIYVFPDRAVLLE